MHIGELDQGGAMGGSSYAHERTNEACNAWLVTETVAVSLVLQNLQNWSGNTQQDLCMRGANAWSVIYAYV